MKQKGLYLLGDSYSRDMASYLQRRLAPWCSLVPFSLGEAMPADADFLLYSPTIDGRELATLRRARGLGLRLVMLIDHGHLSSADHHKLGLTPDLVIQPDNDALYPCRTITGWSAYESWVHRNVASAAGAKRGVLFCSQPLWEDGRGADQHHLLAEVETLARIHHVPLFLLRHPRETRSLPRTLEDVALFSGDVVAALQEDFHWIGYDSMPLYGARALGRKVFLLKGHRPESLAHFIQAVAP